MLAEGQQALAKSLFLGGVTNRFPELNFAFLEGGVAWAAALYCDLVGHWEKRNLDALDATSTPRSIDRALMGELLGSLRTRHAACSRARSPDDRASPRRCSTSGPPAASTAAEDIKLSSSTASSSAARPTTR